MFETDDEVITVVGQWVQKAENDLKNALRGDDTLPRRL